MSDFNLKLSIKAYSEREAWSFLQKHGPEFTCSIRTLAAIWKWHRSKVERFLKILKAEMLVETGIKSGQTLIILRQNQDTSGDKNEVALTPLNPCIEENIEEISRRTQDNFVDATIFKEEKKKRSKKRKEEIKENPPLKGGKKEKKNFIRSNNFEWLANSNEIQVLKEILSQKPKIGPTSVVAEDVIDWAEKNLPKTIDVEWELEKFKDYHLARPKKPPKDSVADFRNWLRRATELQNKNLGGFKHGHNNNKTTESTDLERFFTGGIRALDYLTRSRLEWEIDRKI